MRRFVDKRTPLRYIREAMLLGKVYKAPRGKTILRNEEDVGLARSLYYERPTKNLSFLLENRFAWMNEFIDAQRGSGIEVGAGMGVSKDFIKAGSFLLTDFADHEWLDVKDVDSLNTPFRDKEFDFVISSNMIHHLSSPVEFLKEMHRILKPEGYLLIQEVNCSLALRAALRLTRKEGYSFDENVFDKNVVFSDHNDLWAANNAIPNLLFDDVDRFQRRIPYFKLLKNEFCECLMFLNSGGVTAKTIYVPLPYRMLKLVKAIDDLLISLAPQTFAMQRRVVLQKVKS